MTGWTQRARARNTLTAGIGVCLRPEPWSHLESPGGLKTFTAPPPRVSASGGPGWGQELELLTGFQVVQTLPARNPQAWWWNARSLDLEMNLGLGSDRLLPAVRLRESDAPSRLCCCLTGPPCASSSMHTPQGLCTCQSLSRDLASHGACPTHTLSSPMSLTTSPPVHQNLPCPPT